MVRLSKPQRNQDGDRMGLSSGLWKSLLCVWELLERKQVNPVACAMVSLDNSIWHQKMSHLSTQPCSCQCVNIPECGLPLLGVTRSHLHHRHKQSANSCSWQEQSHCVLAHMHLSNPLPAWLLQHLPRGQHCCPSLAWASKGKILLSCYQ